ncbi:MAG: phosphatase PAP2 family protein [Xanthobacteraceae bacterium]
MDDALKEGREGMALLRIRPTAVDRYVAQRVAAEARPIPEHIEKTLTWGADEHLLLGCAAAAWITAAAFRSPLRPAAGHLLIVAAATAAAPHVLKTTFDQVRPDRMTVKGHLHGIPLSGDSMDAFPSGHAVHMGGLASAATVLPPRYRIPIWGVALGLSGTRIAILAHWVSDVAAGFALGIVLERIVRRFTGYPDRALREVIAYGRVT